MTTKRKIQTPLSLDDDQRELSGQAKDQDLATITAAPGEKLTNNMGQAVSDDQNSLKAGPRGPTLLEDFQFREKMHHFDHERIPERVVHARGAGAHGYFQAYDTSLEQYTMAKVLTDPARQTPVFVRFSTVAGSRGSADTARDVRGFAVRFYTSEGNWDIVGNNIPVFFIQDAIKFPDLIHAVKPEPHNEIPQAASAHDTFYDFISLMPESMHMMMWIHSGRAIPRAFSMMEGFGVHTFRLINAAGESHYVKFHWKPALGVHSLVWDEAQKIAGKDPDFHRRSMFEDIEAGRFPEWELGLQIFTDADADGWDFDILDATKIIPEDLVPVVRVGKLVLNRNPDNYFTETEQVGFNTTNIVPGIDFSNDPLLQGRNFSYLDTQLSRLGSPNWQELPINRPINRVSNFQRDGHMRTTINSGRVSYEPNSMGGNRPTEVPAASGGYVTFPEQVNGPKVRIRSETFGDHYGQAKLFWNSMTPPEKLHIAKSWQFELSKVEIREIRVRMLEHLKQINETLANQVALALGEESVSNGPSAPPSGTADSTEEMAVLAKAVSQTTASGDLERASALSMEEDQPQLAKGSKVAVLVAAGIDAKGTAALLTAFTAAGVVADVVGPHLGSIKGKGGAVQANKTFANTDAVLYDAVFIPAGAESAQFLLQQGDAQVFINEAYKHGKPIGAAGEGAQLLSGSQSTADAERMASHGVVTGTSGDADRVTADFLQALALHRFWGRPKLTALPA